MVVRRGLGLITSSNFFVPQVNLPGSMATFIPPAGIPRTIVSGSGLNGLGQGNLDILSTSDSSLLIPNQPITSAIVEFYGPWVIGGILVLMLLSRR